MAPRNIMADLEERKKKRLEEKKAKAAAKSGPSAGDPVAKTFRASGSKVPPPPPLADKRPHPSSAPSKDDAAEKRQKTTEAGSAIQPETQKGKGAEVLFRQQQHAESYMLDYCMALDETGVATDDARRTSIEVPPLMEPDAAEETGKPADADAAVNTVEREAESQTTVAEGTSVPIEPTTTPDV
ncbi:hypothetical protein RHMOL_Rhmol13G0134200 [Rhododendron molle]|uniref:Uncharacterized protein n=1 Tax=Rhododendron molle TaxID=49168 RepID=A0ACC0L668_RHOML|nr:hypothetical protein RHMOL_Rhmol13G0134200 [Rhododendron molle]